MILIRKFGEKTTDNDPLSSSLAATAEAKNCRMMSKGAISAYVKLTEMEGALLLDVVVRKSAPIFELLASKNETLLVRGNAFLVLNLRLHIVDSIGRFNLDCNNVSKRLGYPS